MKKKYIDFKNLILFLNKELPKLLGTSSDTLLVTEEDDSLCIRVKINMLGCLRTYPKSELNRFYNEIGQSPNVYILYDFKKYFDGVQLKYGRD